MGTSARARIPTTQPSLSAAMIAALGLTGTEQVLEVGTGYGYQTALLARLAARVVSIEIWPDLAARARRNLAVHGVGNVVVLAGDGSEGAPEHAPFDAIIVSAAFPRVPPPLAAELKTKGRLVQPIGPGGQEKVVLYEKDADGLRRGPSPHQGEVRPAARPLRLPAASAVTTARRRRPAPNTRQSVQRGAGPSGSIGSLQPAIT